MILSLILMPILQKSVCGYGPLVILPSSAGLIFPAMKRRYRDIVRYNILVGFLPSGSEQHEVLLFGSI